jgi:uncharacterized protein (DUF1778 family)
MASELRSRLGLRISEAQRATRAAEGVLAERRVFMVSSEVWDRFTAALDQPAADVPGLEELMNTPTVLDEA